MKHFYVLRVLTLSSILGTSQSAKYSGSSETLDQDNEAAAEHNEQVQLGGYDDFIAQHRRQSLLRRFQQAEAVELQARRVIQQNQQVLLKMQQEQELAERRLGDSERQERKIGEPSSDPPNLHVAEEDVGMIHYKQSDEEFWADYNKNFINELIGIGVYMAEVVLFAILYKECMKRSKPDVMPTKVEEDKSDLFAYGLFDTNECCGRDRQMCFCAFCCTWIRWADTASNPRLGPFLEYYPAVFIASLLCAVSVITFGLSMPLLGLVVVLSRSKIRKVYNLESGTCRVLCHDCLVWWCCSPCAIVQEARQVEYVDPPGYPSGPGTGFASA